MSSVAVNPPVSRTRSPLSRWLKGGSEVDVDHSQHQSHPWWLVLWLTGVDYFSTLGYQPGIALLAAGALSPIATSILVLVTLGCALPTYSFVARRSFAGQGSIAMLESLLPGWWGKLFVLALLGFAATDFVITMTLSAADAATHAIENPLLHAVIGEHQILVTLVLLALLTAVFLKGFREAIGLASVVCMPYLVLTGAVLAVCLGDILARPDVIANWQARLMQQGGNWGHIGLLALVAFPKLALGLSGFETGVTVMPLIKGDPGDAHKPVPEGRVRNTQYLLTAAALIMSVMLIASSFVTTLLIPEAAYREGGKASGRAIAYLAHERLGSAFGTVYDISTILILWFAGASAMAGLLNLIPRYLPRFGMAPHWVAYARPLVIILFGVDVVVTLIFRANVEAQGGAYATGVLVLMLSAAVASALALRRDGSKGLSTFCWVVSVIFGYTLVTNVHERPDGVIIASFFIGAVLVIGVISRFLRATELRVAGMELSDEESARLWPTLVGKRIHLAPYSEDSTEQRAAKAQEIREHYKVEGPFAFVHVHLLDNRSEFLAPLQVQVCQDGDNFVVHLRQAVATANAIAYISEQLDPKSIFLELSQRNMTEQSLRFLLFGEGEVGLMVYSILLRYWDATPELDVRPNIFLVARADNPYHPSVRGTVAQPV